MYELSSTSAEEITVGSGSNLAIALSVLPQSRRRDMRVFYAFCRVVDDLADEPGLPIEMRRDGLKMWRDVLLSKQPLMGEPPLATELRRVISRHEVPAELACEIVLGCEMDLAGNRYQTWPDLRKYCYRVASAVGLVSARIFGGVGCERYAEDLGLALQVTNILRDSAEDFSVSGRVYFPLEELAAFGITPGDWTKAKPAQWDPFMKIQCERARGFYLSAIEQLPRSQSRVMVAAEIMRAVYGELLDEMEKDGFRVWDNKYRLGRMRKLWLMASVFVRTCLESGKNDSYLETSGGNIRL